MRILWAGGLGDVWEEVRGMDQKTWGFWGELVSLCPLDRQTDRPRAVENSGVDPTVTWRQPHTHTSWALLFNP